MTDFKKFASIENHYQIKHILRWLNKFPELNDEIFVIEEKIDGANIQIYVTPDGNVKVGKRSKFLTRDENFFGIWELIDGPYAEVVDLLKNLSKQQNFPIRIYGEIYGNGVQNRIKYNVEGKSIVFFDIVFDDKFLTRLEWEKFYLSSYLSSLDNSLDNTKYVDIPFVKIIDFVIGIQNALSYERDFKSYYAKDGEMAEGFVIKPYKKNYYFDEQELSSRFVLKGKSDKFAEKMKVVPKEKKELPERVLEAYNKFNSYVTDNRLENIIGNNGPIDSPKQFGQYIKYMVEDMKKDFKADGFDESSFDDKELKQIFNVGHKVVTLLKARL